MKAAVTDNERGELRPWELPLEQIVDVQRNFLEKKHGGNFVMIPPPPLFIWTTDGGGDFAEVTIQYASGGPAGGQAFEKFDKQALRTITACSKAVDNSSFLDLTIMHPLLAPSRAGRQKGMRHKKLLRSFFLK